MSSVQSPSDSNRNDNTNHINLEAPKDQHCQDTNKDETNLKDLRKESKKEIK